MSEAKDTFYERAAGVLEPDTLVPSQYFDRLRRRVGQGGEWGLIVAILEDAVNVYLKQAAATEPQNRRLFDEAEQWIEAHEPDWIFSFVSICDLLGIDPDYVRGGLRAAKARARRAPRTERPVRIEVGSGARKTTERDASAGASGESDDDAPGRRASA